VRTYVCTFRCASSFDLSRVLVSLHCSNTCSSLVQRHLSHRLNCFQFGWITQIWHLHLGLATRPWERAKLKQFENWWYQSPCCLYSVVSMFCQKKIRESSVFIDPDFDNLPFQKKSSYHVVNTVHYALLQSTSFALLQYSTVLEWHITSGFLIWLCSLSSFRWAVNSISCAGSLVSAVGLRLETRAISFNT